MAIDPITRREMFMAKVAGENVNVPEPITREEKYLKYMADNSASKYFVEQTETLLDKEYDIDNSSTKRDPLAVTVGDNVRVTFDGAEYNCTVLSLGNYLSIGNEAAWAPGGKDTGEPFCIHVTVTGSTFIRVHSSNVGTHSIKVEKILGKTIDHKFLPEGYPYEESAVLFDQRVELFEENGMGSFAGEAPEALQSLVNGETYIVTYNGIAYNCVCFNGSLGNFLIYGMEDTGEPFAIIITDDDGSGEMDMIVADYNGAASATIRIEKSVIHTIDPKFLPETGAGFNVNVWYENGEYVSNKTYEQIKAAEAAKTPITGTLTIADGKVFTLIGADSSAYAWVNLVAFNLNRTPSVYVYKVEIFENADVAVEIFSVSGTRVTDTDVYPK